MKVQVYEVKEWEVTEKRSPFIGFHHSGIVQIPVNEFTAEQMKVWTDSGALTLIEEKEVDDVPEASVPGIGKKYVMNTETGQLGATTQEAEAVINSNQEVA